MHKKKPRKDWELHAVTLDILSRFCLSRVSWFLAWYVLRMCTLIFYSSIALKLWPLMPCINAKGTNTLQLTKVVSPAPFHKLKAHFLAYLHLRKDWVVTAHYQPFPARRLSALIRYQVDWLLGVIANFWVTHMCSWEGLRPRHPSGKRD